MGGSRFSDSDLGPVVRRLAAAVYRGGANGEAGKPEAEPGSPDMSEAEPGPVDVRAFKSGDFST